MSGHSNKNVEKMLDHVRTATYLPYNNAQLVIGGAGYGTTLPNPNAQLVIGRWL